MKRYIYTLYCILLSAAPAYADNVAVINSVDDINQVELPVDSAALNFAIEKISDTDTAKNMIYTLILNHETITAGDLLHICCGAADDCIGECASFVREYVDILTNRTNCMKANNFALTDLTFKQCGEYVNAAKGFSEEDTKTDRWGNCKRWYEFAEKCQIYLIYYYQNKLLDPDITTKDQKKYKCILNKLELGQIDIPTSNMERSCK